MLLCRRHLVLRIFLRRSFMTAAPYLRMASPIYFGKVRSERKLDLPAEVTTLDPVRLTSANYFDISDPTEPLHRHFRRIRSQQIPDPHMRQYGSHLYTSDVVFPENTRGFLYLNSPSNQSPLAASVRFRITGSDDPRTLAAGHDLLMDHGLPWKIPIIELLRRPRYRHFTDLLTNDGLAPPELKLVAVSYKVERDTVFIGALGEPWVIDFGWEFARIVIVAPDGPPVASLIKLPWYIRSSNYPTPFSGRGIVSIIQLDTGDFGLRLEKVLKLSQHTFNKDVPLPLEGMVTHLETRPILRTTKMAEPKMDELFHFVTKPLQRLPWRKPNPDPLDVYRHRPLSPNHLRFLRWGDDYLTTEDPLATKMFGARRPKSRTVQDLPRLQGML